MPEAYDRLKTILTVDLPKAFADYEAEAGVRVGEADKARDLVRAEVNTLKKEAANVRK